MQTGQAVVPALDSPDGDNNWLVARNSFLRITDWSDDPSFDDEDNPSHPAASDKVDVLANQKQQQQPSNSKQNPVVPVAKQRGVGVDAAVVPKVQYIPGPAAAMPTGHSDSSPNTAAAGRHAPKSSNGASAVPTKAGATPTRSGPHFKDQTRQGGVASSGGSATSHDVSYEQNRSHLLISAELVDAEAPAAERTPSSLPILLGAQVVDPDKEQRQRRCLKVSLYVAITMLIMAGMAGGLSAYYLLRNNVTAPTPSPTPSPSLATVKTTLAPTMSRSTVIQELVWGSTTTGPASESSPQGQALDWLVADQTSDLTIPLLSDDRLMARYALAVFYFALNGPNWVVQANFLSPAHHECDWTIVNIGVGCDSNRQVNVLSLANNGLSGTLPDEMELLSTLQHLNLRGAYVDGGTSRGDSNSLGGPIPTQLGTLSRLLLLDLSQNILSGMIPTELAQLDDLVELRLNENVFTGTIPAVIGTMSSLTYVDLENNSLTGPVPTSLLNITCFLLGTGNNLTSCPSRRRLQVAQGRDPENCGRVSFPCGLSPS
jgi:hypothetical protein